MKTLWLDFETTGLDPEEHDLLEIGAVLSDDDFKVIGALSLPVRPQTKTVTQWKRDVDQTVLDMHTETGLWSYVAQRGVPLENAQDFFYSWLDSKTAPGETLALGGSGVARFERPWIRKCLPMLEKGLHYRERDASSVRYVLSDAGIDIPPREIGDVIPHRAQSDAYDSYHQWVWAMGYLIRTDLGVPA